MEIKSTKSIFGNTESFPVEIQSCHVWSSAFPSGWSQHQSKRNYYLALCAVGRSSMPRFSPKQTQTLPASRPSGKYFKLSGGNLIIIINEAVVRRAWALSLTKTLSGLLLACETPFISRFQLNTNFKIIFQQVPSSATATMTEVSTLLSFNLF